MKLKDYLWNYSATTPLYLEDADCHEKDMGFLDSVLFRDKTLVPKEVLDLEVRQFIGSTFYPGDFCRPDELDMYDPYEDWNGCVKFLVEGFKPLKEKLRLKGVVK